MVTNLGFSSFSFSLLLFIFLLFFVFHDWKLFGELWEASWAAPAMQDPIHLCFSSVYPCCNNKQHQYSSAMGFCNTQNLNFVWIQNSFIQMILVLCKKKKKTFLFPPLSLGSAAQLSFTSSSFFSFSLLWLKIVALGGSMGGGSLLRLIRIN